jgi:Family of unknown function (DUF6644)
MHYLLPFFKWTDSTWLAETMRGSRLYFPIVETFHLLALTLLFGAILMLNLRLCRLVMKDLPVQQVASDLSPWLLWSLVIILVSGFMLFSSEAMKCYASVPFQAKMLFLFTAMIYHFTIYRRVTNTDREPKPASGATVAVISVVLWLGVGLAGRGIGFL